MAKKKDFKKKLKENYSLSLDYIKTSKNYIYASIIIFAVFTLIGYFTPIPQNIESLLQQFIEELILKTQGMNFSEISLFIFWNNIQSSFMGLVYGIVLGIFPVIAAIANGYLLGYVASESVSIGGIFILWRILPHGIFELPALFISLGLGIKFGTFIFNKEKIETLRDYFWNSIRVFVLIIIPLLVVAAIIEGALITFLS